MPFRACNLVIVTNTVAPLHCKPIGLPACVSRIIKCFGRFSAITAFVFYASYHTISNSSSSSSSSSSSGSGNKTLTALLAADALTNARFDVFSSQALHGPAGGP